MKKPMLLLILLFLTFTAQAQYIVTGRVIDEVTSEPLEFVSVYVNTTTRGTATDEMGRFSLKMPPGKYELVVTYLGYEPIIFQVDTEQLPPSILFKLRKKEISLQEVVVKGKRDQSWYDNLALFKEYFLGRSALAQQCKLLNPEVLTIIFDYQTGVLDVSADELLQIEHPALGYKIEYLLGDFKLYTREGYTYFLGYPRYSPLKGGRVKQNRWAKRRETAYNGSAMHFVRALRQEKIKEEGFNLRRLYRMPNPNRPTDDEIAEARKVVKRAGSIVNVHDSIANILARASQPKLIERLDTNAVAYNEYLFFDDEGVKLAFKDFMQVVYTGEKEDEAYIRHSSSFNNRKPSYQTSVISVQRTKFVMLEENGTVTPPLNLLLEGYWGFEKLGDMLPLDYKL
jgi:hypothetical protein